MEVPLGEAAIQVFDYMIDDMNIAEHLGLIVDEQYRWRLRGSARLIELGASAGEVKQFFKQKWPGA